MNIAFSYDSLQASAAQVFGLQVAIRNWLHAYLRYGRQEKLPFLVRSRAAEAELFEAAAVCGIDPARLVPLDGRFPKENFSAFDTVFRPDSAADPLLWQRELLSTPGYAFCGLSHTIAGLESGRVLEQYCLAPSGPGDAIICPSQSIRSVIRRFWDEYETYLNRRFGTSYRCAVDLPVIPLGIDIERMRRISTPEKRAEQRKKLGMAEGDIALLWVGRLSAIIKAHPLPMFRAAEEAAKRTGAKVHLLMQGYFYPPESEAAYRDLAASVCQQAQVHFVANDDPAFPDGLWAAGDIFLSLVDNMQESFGLTPIEAIAAGLPRVVSDWDGYRESVKHGEDGFLIPTTQPPVGEGAALSQMLLGEREIYGGFLAKTSLCVAVDAEAATDAVVQLIQNPDLRRRFVEAAKKRLPDYDWKNIIPAHEALWDEQAAKRRQALNGVAKIAWPAIPPQAPDPFTMYESFPTAPLAPADRLRVVATTEEIKLLLKHEMNIFVLDVLPPPNRIMEIINWIAANPDSRISALLKNFADIEAAKLWRTAAWLLKLGIFRLV